MNREDMLAKLIAQAASEGGELSSLRAMLEDASEAGADRVLARLGLADEGAQGDIDELRELLRAWRDAKASMRRAVIEWIVRTLLALLLIGLALRFGLAGMLK